MAKYLQIHTTTKTLVDDAKNLVDDYTAKKITEDEFFATLDTWATTCPNLMFDGMNERKSLRETFSKRIGKRRALAITMAFTRK